MVRDPRETQVRDAEKKLVLAAIYNDNTHLAPPSTALTGASQVIYLSNALILTKVKQDHIFFFNICSAKSKHKRQT